MTTTNNTTLSAIASAIASALIHLNPNSGSQEHLYSSPYALIFCPAK